MNGILALFVFTVFLALVFSQVQQGSPHVPQGHPYENQLRFRRQAAQGGQESQPDEDQVNDLGLVNITTCDPTTVPRLSCEDCRVRQICKPNGLSIHKFCGNPYKPYCNNGICSPVPVDGCSL